MMKYICPWQWFNDCSTMEDCRRTGCGQEETPAQDIVQQSLERENEACCAQIMTRGHNRAKQATVDGDEMNIMAPYTAQGQREVREIIFVTWNMASLASQSLLVGYHQDVNLSAHILTMEGTFVQPRVWRQLAQTVWEAMWRAQYPSFDGWVARFEERCRAAGVEMYHGRCLYSTVLPETMTWQMGNARIQNGILLSGTLNKDHFSGTGSSIGMVMYHTYGPRICVDWLNVSYRMLNRYLIIRGITLGFSHLVLTPAQQAQIDIAVNAAMQREDLQFDVDTIEDPVIRARREIDITQELNNVRESAAVVVMNPTDPKISVRVNGRVTGDIILYVRPYTVYPDCREDGSLCLRQAPVFPPSASVISINQVERHTLLTQRVVIPSGVGASIDADLYGGQITLNIGGTRYTYSMGIVPLFEATLVQVRVTGEAENQVREETLVDVRRFYEGPNPLRAMVQSKARGNATNAVQIAGIIGQQTYSNGRVPRSLPGSRPSSSVLDEFQRYEEGGDTESVQDMKRRTRTLPAFPFGSNTPKSRGFIGKSYLQGKSPAEDFASHAASRENLTSNTDLTPRTGYFERRVRTFTENLKITRINGRQVVTNERGVIVMYDYLLDPSRTFRIEGKTTFVDVGYEMRDMKSEFSRSAIVIMIPFLPLNAYLRLDARLNEIVTRFIDIDVVLVCDPRIEAERQDYYDYLKRVLPQQTLHRNIIVITPPQTMMESQISNIYASFSEYDTVTVLSLEGSVPLSDVMVNAATQGLPQGITAALTVSQAPIGGISYPVRRGDIISMNILYQMLVLGSSFKDYPMIIRPNNDLFELLRSRSLLESLILTGNILAM